MAKKEKKPSKQEKSDKPLSADDFLLDDVDKKILKFFHDFPKGTTEECAKVVGICRTLVWARRKKPAYQKATAEMTRDFLDILKEAQTASIRRLIQLVKDPDKEVALKAIKLAMAPYVNSSLSTLGSYEPRTVHTVKFGEGGALMKETVVGKNENRHGATIGAPETAQRVAAQDNDGVVDTEFA